MAACQHSTGASAPSPCPRPARPVPSEVTLPRHVICATQFALAQTATRLERVVCKPPREIDAAILANARDALIALHAAIELARGPR